MDVPNQVEDKLASIHAEYAAKSEQDEQEKEQLRKEIVYLREEAERQKEQSGKEISHLRHEASAAHTKLNDCRNRLMQVSKENSNFQFKLGQLEKSRASPAQRKIIGNLIHHLRQSSVETRPPKMTTKSSNTKDKQSPAANTTQKETEHMHGHPTNLSSPRAQYVRLDSTADEGRQSQRSSTNNCFDESIVRTYPWTETNNPMAPLEAVTGADASYLTPVKELLSERFAREVALSELLAANVKAMTELWGLAQVKTAGRPPKFYSAVCVPLLPFPDTCIAFSKY